ncbi:MAG TPA: sulfite exporter TauE/SafE family protein [Devosia sp.]
MSVDLLHYLLGMLSGSLVGLSLGLFGGGGSILAVPLLVYVVGVADAHTALGTAAVAVAANAAANLWGHARRGNVRWRCGMIYAAAGVGGALLGSTVGKLVDGEQLLLLFALLMLGVAGAMVFRRNVEGNPNVSCGLESAPRTMACGFGSGALSGFFGIGGGFLIVPGLMASTGMTMLHAIGSSLLAVTAFGLTTAGNYALSGFVDWWLAAAFLAGGVAGGMAGSRLASALALKRGLLNTSFAVVIMTVALYMAWRSLAVLVA